MLKVLMFGREIAAAEEHLLESVSNQIDASVIAEDLP